MRVPASFRRAPRQRGDHTDRFEYQLTSMGRELAPALIALMHWGDRHLAEHGPPRIAEHAGCGGELVEHLICSKIRGHGSQRPGTDPPGTRPARAPAKLKGHPLLAAPPSASSARTGG
jgi:hypothetical protein